MSLHPHFPPPYPLAASSNPSHAALRSFMTEKADHQNLMGPRKASGKNGDIKWKQNEKARKFRLLKNGTIKNK
ncbi:hypothetical protein TNCV_3185901 [Trichonephila clavipes]|nr:hypothetical protein TNCV_3185901 [Trichonephila clavipes]